MPPDQGLRPARVGSGLGRGVVGAHFCSPVGLDGVFFGRNAGLDFVGAWPGLGRGPVSDRSRFSARLPLARASLVGLGRDCVGTWSGSSFLQLSALGAATSGHGELGWDFVGTWSGRGQDMVGTWSGPSFGPLSAFGAVTSGLGELGRDLVGAHFRTALGPSRDHLWPRRAWSGLGRDLVGTEFLTALGARRGDLWPRRAWSGLGRDRVSHRSRPSAR